MWSAVEELVGACCRDGLLIAVEHPVELIGDFAVWETYFTAETAESLLTCSLKTVGNDYA